MDELSNGLRRETIDSEEAFSGTLEDVLARGQEVVPGESLSVGSQRPFKEILNYHLLIRPLC